MQDLFLNAISDSILLVMLLVIFGVGILLNAIRTAKCERKYGSWFWEFGNWNSESSGNILNVVCTSPIFDWPSSTNIKESFFLIIADAKN